MPKREWTDDEVKAEIAAAVKIVAEDRERATYAELHGKYGAPVNPEDKGDGKTPPPAKDKEDDKPPKTSLWWGKQEGE